jgi:DNA-binding MarR family transcriptional regulator
MKENTKTVFNYLKEHDGEDIIATDIAEATGLPIKSVNGIVTAALCRKGKDYAERIPGQVQVEDENGNKVWKSIKFIKLTEKGRESTVESIEAEELAIAQAKLAAKNAE